MSLNYGNSSTGRVAVSKTAGCGFDPCFPCKQRNMDKIISYIKDSYDELMHKVEWLESSFFNGKYSSNYNWFVDFNFICLWYGWYRE